METAFFDVRVFNPFAVSAVTTPLPQLYHRHENEKRRKYEQQLQNQNCSFTPLTFPTSGGASPLTHRFLRAVARTLSEKKVGKYSQMLCWLRTTLSFLIMRSASMCLRSARSAKFRPGIEPAAALSAAGRI